MTFRLDATDTTKNVKSAKNVKKKKIIITFFAMFRFFVGTADEKFKHFFIEVPGTFDGKMLFFLHFPFSFATNKCFCELGKC